VEGLGANLTLQLLLLVDHLVGLQLKDGVEAFAAYLAHEALLVEFSLVHLLYVGDEVTLDKERLSTVVARTHPVLGLLVRLQGTRVLQAQLAHLASDGDLDFVHGEHVTGESILILDGHAADHTNDVLLLGPLGHVQRQLVVQVILLA